MDLLAGNARLPAPQSVDDRADADAGHSNLEGHDRLEQDRARLPRGVLQRPSELQSGGQPLLVSLRLRRHRDRQQRVHRGPDVTHHAPGVSGPQLRAALPLYSGASGSVSCRAGSGRISDCTPREVGR